MSEVLPDAMEVVHPTIGPSISIHYERHGKDIEVRKDNPTEHDVNVFLNLMRELAKTEGI